MRVSSPIRCARAVTCALSWPTSELDIELRLLVSRRQDLTAEQTRRLARMHDLLVGIFPEREHALDLTSKTALTLLARYVTPDELRDAGAAARSAITWDALARRSFGRKPSTQRFNVRNASTSPCRAKH